MKTIAQILFFVVIFVLSMYIILSKIEQTNSRCVISVENIEKILKSGEIIEYESN